MFDIALSDWNYLISGLVIGALVAGAVAYLISRRNAAHIELKNLRHENAKLQSEYKEYQQNVRSHFVDTAALLNNVNESHKQLYASMAKSVSVLCHQDGGSSPDWPATTTR